MTNKLPYMSAAQLRRAFLDFFREHGHEIVPSSSLVPRNDPTLLFTNAGMVQFKDVFLGKEKRSYTRAASSQRCVRAGGKHNDLENVGYTARHHTFFEMLGNFSFGDYFKREAIHYAWQFITTVLKLDPARLWVSVYQDDNDAAGIWTREIGIDAARVLRLGEESNFWAMGDTGPCGPCSEIYYDHGPEIPGGPPGSAEEGDRYVELWNLVFMQYERAADGTLTPLPKPSVDTGAGLERMAAVMQGVHSNYDIDLFRELIGAAAAVTGTEELGSPSLRVIADHIRACSFLIVDGVTPSNEGRGYVLRRIIRRAARHGYRLGQSQPFFYKLVPTLVEVMGEAFPELPRAAGEVERVLQLEEGRFAETLATGMARFDSHMRELGTDTVPGTLVFLLHDTYGFPPDLTADIARERGLKVDMAGYERAMQEQRERARAASKFGMDLSAGAQIGERSEFSGHEEVDGEARVVALLRAGQRVDSIAAGELAEVILDRTPFYAEAGGQVGDSGQLESAGGARFLVEDTQKRGAGHAHIGRLASGALQVGDPVHAHIDAERRAAIRLNHSATHLLHAALRQVLGTQVTQKGSLVAPDRLRFDFSHYRALTPEELAAVERLVNAQIRANAEAVTRVMDYDQAIAAGAMALFGEKYDRQVRVLSIGGFSTELCGGTHVRRAGDIGLFHIVSESGVAAGIRRIEALTGQAALDYLDQGDATLSQAASLVQSTRLEVAERVREMLDRVRALEKDNRALRERLALGQGTDLAGAAIELDGMKVLATRVDGADAGALRAAVDQLKQRLRSAVIVLGAVQPPAKVMLVAGVTDDQTARVRAGELIAAVAAQVGGKGGGRADFAQAGGSKPEALDEALASVVPWVRARLASH
jgi:alanyl-tRNA synthetase